MAPQAAAAPQTESSFSKLLKRISAKDAGDRTSPEKQIVRAVALEKDRAELQKKIDANRKYLRLMEQNDELTNDEADFLDDFYPQKEKGERRTDEEIERTRKVKEEARKTA